MQDVGGCVHVRVLTEAVSGCEQISAQHQHSSITSCSGDSGSVAAAAVFCVCLELICCFTASSVL